MAKFSKRTADHEFAQKFHHRTSKFIEKYCQEHEKFQQIEDGKAMLSAVLDFYTSNRLDRFPTEVEDMIVFMKAIIENLGENTITDLLCDMAYNVSIYVNHTDDPKTPGGKTNRWRIDINTKIALEFDVSPIPDK